MPSIVRPRLRGLSPSTAAGKVFTILYNFMELGIDLGFVNAVAERSQERQSEARERRGPGGKRCTRLRTLRWYSPHVDRELGRR